MAYKGPHWDTCPGPAGPPCRTHRNHHHPLQAWSTPPGILPFPTTQTRPHRTMFTIFLVSLAAAASAVMGGLLLRPKADADGPRAARVPYTAISVAAVALGLIALGLWMA